MNEYFEANIKDKINIKIKFGIRKNYCNEVKLITNNSSEYLFTPFFHGLKTSKSIRYNKDGDIKQYNFIDVNSFNIMFDNSYNMWQKNYEINKLKMFNNIVILEKMIKQYKKIIQN